MIAGRDGSWKHHSHIELEDIRASEGGRDGEKESVKQKWSMFFPLCASCQLFHPRPRGKKIPRRRTSNDRHPGRNISCFRVSKTL